MQLDVFAHRAAALPSTNICLDPIVFVIIAEIQWRILLTRPPSAAMLRDELFAEGAPRCRCLHVRCCCIFVRIQLANAHMSSFITRARACPPHTCTATHTGFAVNSTRRCRRSRAGLRFQSTLTSLHQNDGDATPAPPFSQQCVSDETIVTGFRLTFLKNK